MNLAKLMDKGVPPTVMSDALIQRFDLEQVDIASGGWPFNFAFVCRDADSQPRLMVLFAWFGTGWHYAAVHPNRIPRLRLCPDQ